MSSIKIHPNGIRIVDQPNTFPKLKDYLFLSEREVRAVNHWFDALSHEGCERYGKDQGVTMAEIFGVKA